MKALPPKPSTLSLNISIGGAVVKQTFDVQDWSFSTPGPDGAPMVIVLRVFKPGTETLRHLASQMMARARTGDVSAVRQLGLHQLGSLVNPEEVLNSRALTGRDLEKAFECGSRGAAAAFELAVQQKAARASPTDVEGALVAALVGGVDGSFSKHTKLVRRHLSALASVAGREHARVYRDLRASGESYQRFKTPDLEREGLHRAREVLRRRVLAEPGVRRAAALHYLIAADRMVDEANRLNFEALRRSGKASHRELRAFEFLFLCRRRTWSRVQRGRPWFRGIIGNQPYLMSLLRHSPSTVAALDSAIFSPRPRGLTDGAAQRQLVGLFAAGEYVLEAVRVKERERGASRRDRRTPNQSASPALVSALEILRARRAVTDPEREVVDRLAAGDTATEVARSLGISRQAVMNRLRRATKRPPLPATPVQREDRKGMDVATFLSSRRRG